MVYRSSGKIPIFYVGITGWTYMVHALMIRLDAWASKLVRTTKTNELKVPM